MVLDFLPSLLTVVEWATFLVTFVMMGAGVPVCLKMVKQKSTANVPFIMFILAVFICSLGLHYGILVGNRTFVIIHLLSVFVWGSYTAVYVWVSKDKNEPLLKILGVIGLYAAHICYLLSAPSSDHVHILGRYMSLWGMVMCFLPSLEIYTIIKEKSTNCCNLPFLFGGTLNASVWCFYGYLVNDTNIILPIVPSLLVSLIKFGLMFLYGFPSSPSAKKAA